MQQATTQKKILFCIDNLVRGGTELQLIGLINNLDRQEFLPYLLTIRPTDTQLIPVNCTHIAWDVKKLTSLSGIIHLYKLIRFLKKEGIDIVQCYFQDSTLLGGIAAFLARTPTRIACFRDLGFWATPKQVKALSLIYRCMTNFIANADIIRAHFSQLFNIPSHKITVIPNGIDIAKFPVRDIEKTSNPIKVGIVGNMTRHVKRTDLFIKAAAIVIKQHPDTSWHIIGDGHLRGELETLAKDLGVSQNIIFAGRLDNIPQYLESIDIGVICSDSEGLSNAIIEYMLKGCAVVATEVGGNPELIEHQKTGLLTPSNNEQALAEAILHLIENPHKLKHFALAARQKAEMEFSWKNCIHAHKQVYNLR